MDVIARSAGTQRLDPALIGSFTLTGHDGQRVPLEQIGKIENRMEDPILRRRDREPTITVQGGMFMVFLTAPLALVGMVPTLLLFHQPFGFNAILGFFGLAGIIMRNTLILIGQIHLHEREGLDAYHAVVEATVQRSRPVILTAITAALAFIALTQSVFWSSLAFTLIGGTIGGTILTLIFLPALYALWFRIKPLTVGANIVPSGVHEPIAV